MADLAKLYDRVDDFLHRFQQELRRALGAHKPVKKVVKSRK